MVSTRSMAGKATPDEAEPSQLSLRKKPVRRATAKPAQQAQPAQSAQKSQQSSRSSSKVEEPKSTKSTRTTRKAAEAIEEAPAATKPVKPTTRKAAEATQKAQPLSPKKITQVAKAQPPSSTGSAEFKKPVAAASARPGRPLRAAVVKATAKDAEVSKPVAKAPASRANSKKDPLVHPKEVGKEAEEEAGHTDESHQEPVHEHGRPEDDINNADADVQKPQEPAEHVPEEDTDGHDEAVEAADSHPSSVQTKGSTRKPASTTSRRTQRKTPKTESPAQEESEDDLTLAQPPATVSKPPTAKDTPSAPVEATTEESDDEICGPKTPMRRGWTPAKPAPKTILGTTPARRLMLGVQKGTPQTQKIPTKAPAASSPQRPMTIARGLSKPMVFRPLPLPEECSKAPEPSPSKLGNMQTATSDVDMNSAEEADVSSAIEEEEEAAVPSIIEEEEEEADANDNDDLAHDIESPNLHQIDESESEDELHGDMHEETDDEEEDLLDAPNDDIKEPTYEEGSLLISDDEVSEDDADLDEDDETLIQPRLPTELLDSSPAPIAPDMSEDTDIDVTMSDIQSSPAPSTPGSVHHAELDSSPAPSTPGSVVIHRIAEAETPTQDQTIPTTRLSIGEEDEISDAVDHSMSTPDATSRMSFNTANTKMMQTPGMRAFRESNVNFSPTSDSSQEKDESAYDHECINPALLSTQQEAFDLAMEADALAISTPGKLNISLADQAQTLQPASTFAGRLSMVSMEDENPRFSLLRESLLFAPAEYDPSPRKSLSWTSQPIPISQMVPEQTLSTPFQGVEHMDEFMEMDIDLVNTSKELEAVDVSLQSVIVKDFASIDSSPQEAFPQLIEEAAVVSPETPVLPRYARPTFTSEARRMSLPAFGPKTPLSARKRPTTAETTIKPTTSDAFAKLWTAKEEKTKARRSSVRKSDFAPIAQSSTPKSIKTKTPMTERSERRSMRIQKVRMSEVVPEQPPAIQINEQPATPEENYAGPRPRKHTPTSNIVPHSSKRKHPSRTPQPPPRTPMKTPLKAPGATPAAFPMTPHPSQPLKSVTALVEIFTLDGSSASGPFIALLQRLGARTTKVWSERVTHVVFKDGSPTTLQKVRLANKEHASSPDNKEIFCVNSRWVTDCDKDGRRMDERSDEYAVDVDDVGIKSQAAGRHRRRKSMEPASLRNIDGNVVATDNAGSVFKVRRASIGRKSMARVSLASTCWGTPGMSPVKGGSGGPTETPFPNSSEDRENNASGADEESFWGGSEIGTPILPGYMNRQQELEMLQRTAPVNRMKKLRLKGGDDGGRRLTFLDGME